MPVDLLESIRLFDVYRDPERLGPGRKSLAYALRFRAADRTLTVEETGAARDAAVAEAARRLGAMPARVGSTHRARHPVFSGAMVC